MNRMAQLKRTAFAFKQKKEKPDRPARVTHKRGQPSIWRSDAYLALVRSLPCSACGTHSNTQAAHSNSLAFGKGRGIKASDASAMPLCGPQFLRPGCHAVFDQGWSMSKRQRKEFEDYHICKTISCLIDSGRLIAIDKLPAIDCGLNEMASHLVAMIESGELKINQQ